MRFECLHASAVATHWELAPDRGYTVDLHRHMCHRAPAHIPLAKPGAPSAGYSELQMLATTSSSGAHGVHGGRAVPRVHSKFARTFRSPERSPVAGASSQIALALVEDALYPEG